jgi:hypothetical protein
MGAACSANGGGESSIQGYGGKNLRERDHLVDSGLYGRVV